MRSISDLSLCQITPDHGATEQEGWGGHGPGKELAPGGLGLAKNTQLQMGPGPSCLTCYGLQQGPDTGAMLSRKRFDLLS